MSVSSSSFDTTLSHFAGYVIGGGLALLVHLGVLTALVRLADADPLLATSVGFWAAATFNYTFQYYVTFKSRRSHGKTYVRFLAVATVMFGVNALLFAWLTRSWSVPYIYAQMLATAVVMICNFLINKLYIFARP